MQLELVASACGVKLGIFQRSRGLREFVADASPEASDPRDVVAQALAEMICGDAELLDQVVCLAAIKFIKRYSSKIVTEDDERRIAATLAPLIKRHAERSDYRKWAEKSCDRT